MEAKEGKIQKIAPVKEGSDYYNVLINDVHYTCGTAFETNKPLRDLKEGDFLKFTVKDAGEGKPPYLNVYVEKKKGAFVPKPVDKAMELTRIFGDIAKSRAMLLDNEFEQTQIIKMLIRAYKAFGEVK